MTRPERRERWEATFDSSRLALAGVALSTILLFQPSLAGRVAMLAVAAAVAWLSGRRLSPVTAIIVIASIVCANLLVPLGRKLVSWGPLLITETALFEGLRKAVTFEALMFISKACLGPNLRLPGRFGTFFAEALRGYDRILEHKGSVRLATFMKDIDEILDSVYHGQYASRGNRGETGGVPWSAVRKSDGLLAAAIMSALIPIIIH
ncbi:MAG: hypothetical protein CVV51_09215 [Spirochaetae bacterium HGW-Spirochaetae-7]|jgi:hypothetical protein|nr:MAG: hypothetical protein CVV51_09215 [Spirochaetae bacterium HGW-Spirochaetae-7]